MLNVVRLPSGAFRDLGEDAELVPRTRLDKLRGDLGEVDIDPLVRKGFGRYAGGGAAAERVEGRRPGRRPRGSS